MNPENPLRVFCRDFFDVDSAVLSVAARNELDRFAQVMLDYPKTAILVQGHTDSSGSEEYNQRLSEQRADSVKDFLQSSGIGNGRMAAVGYGESRPVADNSSADGRQQNRRVEIAIGMIGE